MDRIQAVDFDPDILRIEEFPYIPPDVVYADFTGAGQCPVSVIRAYSEDLMTTLRGNPHSINSASLASTHRMESVRSRLLDFFNAGDEYDLVFTQNASHALALLGQFYPWDSKTRLILSEDNHNSVHGLREDARRVGAHFEYIEVNEEFRLQETFGERIRENRFLYPDANLVVAYAAQSNFSGVKQPLSFVRQAHEVNADVILDTAAYVPTHRLDLQSVQPDAAVVSFYKVLGLPTGVGALLVRKSFLSRLSKDRFAGGTEKMVTADEYVLRSGHERFEEGTPNFGSIPLLKFVLDFIEKIGGIDAIGRHVQHLTTELLKGLNDVENVQIYGPRTMESRGGTISLNFLLSRD